MKTVLVNYVTTPDKIRALTQSILLATGTINTGRETYLKSLVATTQKELNGSARERGGRTAVLDKAGIATQLAALVKVHDLFYEAVLEACSEDLPNGKEKALELNRRSNFARTAHSAVRGWIRAGKDITTLVPAKVTKASLALPRVQREKSPRVLAKRMDRRITELIAIALQLAEVDKEAAAKQLEGALAKLAESIGTLSAKHSATTSPAKAIAERRPLKTKLGLFYPTEPAPEVRAS